ncbi:type II toxin-antitoxin system Phd/YefM family antitoxin [Roseomonas sp. PWR1]|uniref:Antitoxin n=1 Tax=Roseomonas nitratireducens TaxID=2820810 RepID=A0ABS4ATY0_9PROT|nr:type II toxin-antitoxin system prevent-host-death family antitoxin [Neoroseomonas nitratireducens]MBP0464825.1 type II toxin-antitoxin system Phd/YefM family antitoxin [Neoroseomonas nitratireducens]
MSTLNIHEAKTHLSRLVDRAAAGETVVIAKAGKPMAKLVPLSATDAPAPRIGFLAGAFSVPEDFDTMGGAEIARQFDGA